MKPTIVGFLLKFQIKSGW